MESQFSWKSSLSSLPVFGLLILHSIFCTSLFHISQASKDLKHYLTFQYLHFVGACTIPCICEGAEVGACSRSRLMKPRKLRYQKK